MHVRTLEETEFLHEWLGRQQYEPEKAKCLQQLRAAKGGMRPIDVDYWRRRLEANERLRALFIPDYEPLP